MRTEATQLVTVWASHSRQCRVNSVIILLYCWCRNRTAVSLRTATCFRSMSLLCLGSWLLPLFDPAVCGLLIALFVVSAPFLPYGLPIARPASNLLPTLARRARVQLIPVVLGCCVLMPGYRRVSCREGRATWFHVCRLRSAPVFFVCQLAVPGCCGPPFRRFVVRFF